MQVAVGVGDVWGRMRDVLRDEGLKVRMRGVCDGCVWRGCTWGN